MECHFSKLRLSFIRERLTSIADTAAELTAQLCESNRLREQVRKAYRPEDCGGTTIMPGRPRHRNHSPIDGLSSPRAGAVSFGRSQMRNRPL